MGTSFSMGSSGGNSGGNSGSSGGSGYGLNTDQGFNRSSGGTFSTYNQNEADAANRALQQALTGQTLQSQSDISAARNAAATQQAQIAAGASEYATSQKQQRFNSIAPWIQQQYGSLGASLSAGGSSGASPEISVGGVLNPQQVQQQVNTMRATNDQTTAGQIHSDANGLAGRGFGSNSPLQQMLTATRQMGNNANNAGQETTTRLNAAQENATHLLSSQQAREQQFAQRQQEDIARRTPIIQSQSALLASLAGLV